MTRKEANLAAMARLRKSRVASGLTTRGTVRVYTKRPELRGLSGNQYKKVWEALFA